MELTSTGHDKADKIASARQRDDARTSDSSKPEAGTVAALHRAVGNQVVQRMHENGGIRDGLTVSDPGDPAEREAERVAGRVVDRTEPVPSGSANEAHLGGSVGPKLRAPDPRYSPRRTKGAFESAPDDPVETSIDRLRQGGHELPRNVRNRFESALGADLKRVRIHTRGTADRAARFLDARAFTIGNHVVFRRGEYDPSTPDGRRLLAHELSHVVQWKGDPNVVHRQATRSGTMNRSTGKENDRSNRYAKALVNWLGEQEDGKGTIPLSTSQEYKAANGIFTFDVDGELVLIPSLATDFEGISITWKPRSGEEGESNQTYSLDIGPQKTSFNWTYDPDLWTIEIGTAGRYGDKQSGEQGDVYTKVRADVDIAQLLVHTLSGGLMERVEEKTNGAVELIIDGIIGFEFRFGEGNDAIELHQNYADLKLGFKVDFWKLVEEMKERERDEQESDERKDTEEPGGYTPEAGIGPVSTSSDFGLSFETGAEFQAETTYGETDGASVEPTTAEVSTEGYLSVQVGYFTVDLTLWKGEAESAGTLTERQAMRDRALASGLIDAMETVPLEDLRGAATYDEMASLVDTINEAWATAPDQYIRNAKSTITESGSVVDWEWQNNYPMLFREVGGVDYFSVYSTVHHILEIARRQDPAVERKVAVISRWPGRHGVEISERHRKALLDWQVAVDTAERLAMRTNGGVSRSELLEDAVSLKSHVDMMLEKYTVATLEYVGIYEMLVNISGLSPERIVRELTRLQKRNRQASPSGN